MEKYLGKNLLFLRKRGGWQQAEMLGVIGIKSSTWGMYENDKSQPNLDMLIYISKFFGVTETDLLHTDLEANANPNTQREGESRPKYDAESGFNQSMNEDKTPFTLRERIIKLEGKMKENEAKNAKRIAQLEARINALSISKK